MSDDSSEYSSSGSESSDNEPQQLLTKPVFIKRSNKKTSEEKPLDLDPSSHSDKLLRNLENVNGKQNEMELESDFNGVDDTDGLDPEAEYNAWRVREYNRYLKSREQMIELEDEESEKLRRRNMTLEQLEQQNLERMKQSGSNRDSYNIGAFGSNDDEFKKKIKDRDYSEKKLDHSRPTRFKPFSK